MATITKQPVESQELVGAAQRRSTGSSTSEAKKIRYSNAQDSTKGNNHNLPATRSGGWPDQPGNLPSTQPFTIA